MTAQLAEKEQEPVTFEIPRMPTLPVPYPQIERDTRRVPISESSRIALDKVIAMVPELRSRAKEIELAKRLPQDIIDRMAEAHCWTMASPEELGLGGGEVDYPYQWRIMEELGRGSPTAGWCVLTSLAAATLSNKMTLDGARRLWKSPSTEIAGTPGTGGKALRVEGGYRLVSGNWAWATNSGHATNFMGGFQVVDHIDEELISFPPRPGLRVTKLPEIRIAYFERSDVTIGSDSWHTLGLRGTHSGTFSVTDVFVPEEMTVPMMGPNIGTTKGPVGIGGHAAVMVGAARWALEYLHVLAGSKDPVTVGGTSGSLRTRPIVQAKIAEIEIRFRAARAQFFDIIHDCWARWLDDPSSITRSDHLLSQMANVYTARICKQTVDEIFEICGTSGLFDGEDLQYIVRDMMTMQAHMSVQTKNYESYGKALTGIDTAIWGIF